MHVTKQLIGERVGLARHNRGWTMNYLASRIGISRQSLHAIEHGKTWPGIVTLVSLAQMLECSLDWLCGLTDPRPLDTPPDTDC